MSRKPRDFRDIEINFKLNTLFYNTTVDIYHNGYPIFNIVIQARKGAVIKMVPSHFAEGKGKEDAGVNDFGVGEEG